ncbi:tetratricopeptide repeat protein 16 [Rhynchonycteris naso]
MTDSRKDALGLGQALTQHSLEPRVTPFTKGILQRIFGTSQAFRSFDDKRPTGAGLTVPLKVRDYYNRGHQCLEQGNWESAVLFFSRALHLDSQLVDFYTLKAEAYIQLCDFSSATQNLRRACSLQPENTNYLEQLTLVLYLQGQCLFEQRAFLDALNIFSQASELQPEKACFRYRCMACLLALKQHHDCLSLVTEEVNQGTTNADVYILRARLYNFLQKPSLCYQDLHSALLLDPKHPEAKALLRMMVDQAQKSHQDAKILAVQGKLQHALQCISSAIDNNPLDPSLFLFRGTMYRRLQEFDGAVEDFLRALAMMTELQEDMVQLAQRQLLLTYNDFAVHCYKQGAYQESVLLLNKALKDEHGEKGLYINRGDCFFQLGHLTFAEADYQQALALSPQDKDANLRLGLLHEKMGFCEQRGRQLQKAESHFSMAIRHSPQKAQYYLHRARVRYLMQDIFGARQDVATALLLNPKQPKLLPLMTNLFPGMSEEEVLRSQMAQLAKLLLSRELESRQQETVSQGIVGQLRKRELERQKARALQLSWKQEQPMPETSEELDSTPETLELEAKGPKEEEQPEPASCKVRSLSDSYLDQTSSGSILDFRSWSASETGTSTICQEYPNSSATTTVTFSDSSPLKTQSSDLEDNREDLSLSLSLGEIKAAWGQGQRPSETEVTRGQGQRPSETEATQGQGQRPSETEVTRGQGQRPSETEVTRGQGQRPSETEAARAQGQRPSETEATRGQGQRPSETEAARGQRQRSRETEVARGQTQRTSKTEAARGKGHRSSETEAAQGQSRSAAKPGAMEHQSQNERPSETEATQGPKQKPKTTKAAQGSRQRLRKTKVAHGRSWKPSEAKATQGQSWRLTQSSSKTKTKTFYGPSNTKATQGQGQSTSPDSSKT